MVFCAAPVGRCRRSPPRRSTRGEDEPWSPTSARPSASVVEGSATTRASSAGTRWRAPRPRASRTPAPTCSRAPLVPDPDRQRRRGCSTTACSGTVADWAHGRRRSTPRPRPADGDVSHLPHVLANVLVAQAARALGGGAERLPEVGPASATPPGWPGPIRRSGATSSRPTATRWWSDRRRRRAAARGRALRGRRARRGGRLARAPREDRRELLEAELAGGPLHELRVSVPNQPGRGRRAGARARPRRRQHRGHGPLSRRRHALRRRLALDRGRRRSGARRGAGARAGSRLPGWPG